MRLWFVVFFLLVLVLSIWQLWYVLLIGVEKPSYVVVKKQKEYEVRKYEGYLAASVFVTGSYAQAANKGFTILANYIFGDNSEDKSMPMTAPVFVQERENGYEVSFVMPFEYELKTLPKPRDEKIIIKRVPEKTVAAYRFTWYPTEKRVAKKKKEFAVLLNRDGVKTGFSICLARYNPPFILPFLMLNELLVEIEG